MLTGEGDPMAFLRAHQLDLMLFMSGICGILAVLTAVPRSLSSKRKSILALMEIAAMCLLQESLLIQYRKRQTPI